MPSTLEFVAYIADQLREADGVTYKKLFGEYGLWRSGLFFGTVENDQLYVKVTGAGSKVLQDAGFPDPEPVAPHGGNPDMYCIEELEDTEFLSRLVRETCAELEQKGRRKKK